MDKVIVTQDDQPPYTLNECPPGLFIFKGILGFKSEYTSTLENPRRYQVDAYVVESGEYFHGGAKNSKERGELIVQPLAAQQQVEPVPVADRVSTTNPVVDHETGNVSDKLRPAVEVWRQIYTAWDDADPSFNHALNQHNDDLLAASMIEADRQATRAALVAEICEWLTKNSAEICDWSPPTIAAAIIDEEWSKP